MNNIFNFFGSILGYPLWWLYLLVRNYGVAIILFTVIVNALLFPFSIKQQRSMAATGKLALKQQQIQKKYAKDKQRMQIEMEKLYEKEGVNPAGGCFTMILPFLVMIGLFYTVQNPLSNALHISNDAIGKSLDMLGRIPGISGASNTQYAQIGIVKNFASLSPYLTMFSAGETARLQSFSHGFMFCGLNLLDTPCDASNIFGTLFRSNLWVIPVLCLVVYLLTQYLSFKMQPSMQQQQGCMKFMFYFMAFISAWFACTVPAAVGFYWIVSSIVGFFKIVILNVWYSMDDLNAQAEARHIARLEQEETAIEPLPARAYLPKADEKKVANTQKRRK